MKKEELNKCGKNIYWNNYVIDYTDQVNYLKFKNESSNKCFVKFNYKLLSRLCKIDCINEKYTVSESKSYSTLTNPNSEIPIERRYNIYLIYKPKLNIQQLCSNFGGLISMYFGLSMINIAIITCSKILYIKWIKLIKIMIVIIFKYIMKILFYMMMVYQLIIIIQSFIEENRQIQISFTNEIKMNKIALCIESIIDFRRNDEYFPKFKYQYYFTKFNTKRYSLVHDHIYNIFLHNLTLFIYITRLFDRKIECNMEFENNIQLDCGEIILSTILDIGNKFQLYYNIPADNIINSTKHLELKQISIKIFLQKYDKYTDFKTSFSIYFHNSIFLSYLPNEQHFITVYSYNINNFIVEPTYYRRLTHFGRQCDPRDKSLFDDSLTDDCIMNCFRKRSINNFNCIPFRKNFGFIRWKRDIMENNSILCNQSYNENIYISTYLFTNVLTNVNSIVN